MGSVVDYVRCPQCGGVYFRDYYYRTSEEYRSCSRCGKTESWSIERDEAGNAVLDEGGKPRYIEESHAGCGAARIMGTKGVGTVLHFIKPIDEQTKAAFLETLASNPDIDTSMCYLTAWDDAKGEVVAVYGEIPPLYEEEESDERRNTSEEVPICE